MRIFVIVLALLAGAKVWTQDSLFRSGAEEALIAAYGQRAIQACQKQPAPAPMSLQKIDWTRPDSIKMSTGSPAADVNIWQVDNELWSTRYRNPFLVLQAASGTASCEYDILAGRARLS